MAYQFKAIRRVEFADTDMAGIMHYSNFFRFMETAEHAFFRSLGLSIVDGQSCAAGGWPRCGRSATSKRRCVLRMKWKFTCWSSEKKSKALSYIFKFRKLNATPPQEVARGALTVVCVRRRRDGTMAACTNPAPGGPQNSSGPAKLLNGLR